MVPVIALKNALNGSQTFLKMGLFIEISGIIYIYFVRKQYTLLKFLLKTSTNDGTVNRIQVGLLKISQF